MWYCVKQTTCPRDSCKHHNSNDARYCAKCGQRLGAILDGERLIRHIAIGFGFIVFSIAATAVCFALGACVSTCVRVWKAF